MTIGHALSIPVQLTKSVEDPGSMAATSAGPTGHIRTKCGLGGSSFCSYADRNVMMEEWRALFVGLILMVVLNSPVCGGTSSTFMETSNFQQFGDPAGQNRSLYGVPLVDDDGTVYLLFASSAHFDDTGSEYSILHDRSTGYDSGCYVRKMDSDLNTVWTRSIRSSGDADFSTPYIRSACVPRAIDSDPTDSTQMILLYSVHKGFNSVPGYTQNSHSKQMSKSDGSSGTAQQLGSQSWHSVTKTTVFDGLDSDFKFTIVGHHNFMELDPYSRDVYVNIEKSLYRYSLDGTLQWTFLHPTLSAATYPDNTYTRGLGISADGARLYVLQQDYGNDLTWMVVLDAATGVATSQDFTGPVGTNRQRLAPWPVQVCTTCDSTVAGYDVIYFVISQVNQDPTADMFGLSAASIPTVQTTDVYLVRARGNSTYVAAEWISALQTSLADSAGLNQKSLYSHGQHGVFLVGYTEGAMTGFTAQGKEDFAIWWYNHDGTSKGIYQGGTSETDMILAISFNTAADKPPFIVGVTQSDVDGSGPMLYSGPQTDIVYGFFNFTSGCDAGYYRSGIPSCTPCATGYYSTDVDSIVCTSCPLGSETHVQFGATNCTTCNEGYYAEAANTAECTACALGYFAGSKGSTSCNPCVEGTYTGSVGSPECLRCPIGYYNDNESASSCKRCPLESTTSGESSSSIQLCTCAKLQYGNPTGAFDGTSTECKACPANTECDVNQQYPLPVGGYWLTASNPDVVLKCSPSSACPGGATDACATGYTSEGCTNCDEGYYRSEGSCVECPSIPSSWISFLWFHWYTPLLILAIIFPVLFVLTFGLLCVCALAICFFCLGRSQRRALKRMIPMILNIVRRLKRTFINQGIHLSQMLTVVMSVDVPLPTSFGIISNITEWASRFLSLVSVFPIECFGPTGRDVADYKMYMQASLFVLAYLIGVLILACGFLTAACCPKLARRGIVVTAVTAVLQAMMILYLTVHNFILRVYSCFEFSSGDYRMIYKPDVACFVTTGSWPGLAAIAMVGFIMWSVGIPLVIGWALGVRRCHSRGANSMPTNRAKFIFGITEFLVDPYYPQFHSFELVNMMEKFVLPFAVVLSIMSPMVQAIFLLAVLVTFFLINYRVRVYNLFEEYLWVLSSYSTVTLIVLVSYGVAGNSESTSDDKYGDWIIGSVTYICLAWMLALALITIVLILWELCCKSCNIKRKSRVAPSQSRKPNAGDVRSEEHPWLGAEILALKLKPDGSGNDWVLSAESQHKAYTHARRTRLHNTFQWWRMIVMLRRYAAGKPISRQKTETKTQPCPPIPMHVVETASGIVEDMDTKQLINFLPPIPTNDDTVGDIVHLVHRRSVKLVDVIPTPVAPTQQPLERKPAAPPRLPGILEYKSFV